jgi:hypothetical protein
VNELEYPYLRTVQMLAARLAAMDPDPLALLTLTDDLPKRLREAACLGVAAGVLRRCGYRLVASEDGAETTAERAQEIFTEAKR